MAACISTASEYCQLLTALVIVALAGANGGMKAASLRYTFRSTILGRLRFAITHIAAVGIQNVLTVQESSIFGHDG